MNDPFRIISEEDAGIALLVLTVLAIVWDSVQRFVEKMS